jgi:hypothetical protein
MKETIMIFLIFGLTLVVIGVGYTIRDELVKIRKILEEKSNLIK